jgi:hypothetical protein
MQIVIGMIGAGPSGHWLDGAPKTNGVVVGFMGALGKALCAVDTHGLADALLSPSITGSRQDLMLDALDRRPAAAPSPTV